MYGEADETPFSKSWKTNRPPRRSTRFSSPYRPRLSRMFVATCWLQIASKEASAKGRWRRSAHSKLPGAPVLHTSAWAISIKVGDRSTPVTTDPNSEASIRAASDPAARIEDFFARLHSCEPGKQAACRQPAGMQLVEAGQTIWRQITD